MIAHLGPKLIFSLPFQHSNQTDLTPSNKDSIEECNFEKKEQDFRHVHFADSSIIFLTYQNEEISRFRTRLKDELEKNPNCCDSVNLNPELYATPPKRSMKSCFKYSLDLNTMAD